MPRYNKDPNPSCANNTTGRSSAATGAMTRVTSGLSSWFRPTATRATMTGAAGQLWGAQYNPGFDLSGRVFTLLVQWSFDRAAASDAGPFFPAYNSAGTHIGNLSHIAIPSPTPSAPQTTVVAGTAPAGTARIAAGLYGGTTLTSGLVMTLGAIRIEEVNDPNIAYRDGNDQLWGWAWDGTAGSSSSTRTADEGAEWWALLETPWGG